MRRKSMNIAEPINTTSAQCILFLLQARNPGARILTVFAVQDPFQPTSSNASHSSKPLVTVATGIPPSKRWQPGLNSLNALGPGHSGGTSKPKSDFTPVLQLYVDELESLDKEGVMVRVHSCMHAHTNCSVRTAAKQHCPTHYR